MLSSLATVLSGRVINVYAGATIVVMVARAPLPSYALAYSSEG